MLGCVAISKLITRLTASQSDDDIGESILRIALSAVAGVVNAMKVGSRIHREGYFNVKFCRI